MNALTSLSPNPVLNPATIYLASLDSPASRSSIASALSTVASLLGHTVAEVDWSTLRAEHATLVKAALAQRGLSAASVNLALTALRGVARQAWRQGLIGHEQLLRLLEVKPVRNSRLLRGRLIGREELAAIEATLTSARDRALWHLLGCGLRRAEVVGIRRADARADEVVVLGKGNKERTVPLTSAASAAVAAWIAECPENEWLFPGRTSGHLHADRVYKILLQATGGRWRPHDLRRTFITRMLDVTDSATVAHLVGHSSVNTTRRYDQDADRRARDAMQRFRLC